MIARETIAAPFGRLRTGLRKDVTAKCVASPAVAGGGDRHQPQEELLDKQKKGKARMREDGNVSIPQEAFIAALRMGEE